MFESPLIIKHLSFQKYWAAAGQTNLVGEKENRVTFVNTHKEVAETGINTNNMPFIVLAGLSASAFIVLAVAKKKKMSE